MYRLISLEELGSGNGPALGVYRTSRSCIGAALAPVLSTCPSLLWSYFHVHLFYSFLHIGTPFFGQISGVPPVFNQLWEPAASSQMSLRLDLVPFNYVDRSIVGPQSKTEGMGPVVSICNNGASAPPPVVAFRVRHDAVGHVGWISSFCTVVRRTFTPYFVFPRVRSTISIRTSSASIRR